MAEPMLSVYNINVWYGAIHAIKDISFNVNEGEIVALIGANGAGKSTTLKTVSGLLRSKTGSIKFMGEDITHTPADKLVGKGLAQVPEGRRAFLSDDGRGEPGDGCLYAAQVHPVRSPSGVRWDRSVRSLTGTFRTLPVGPSKTVNGSVNRTDGTGPGDYPVS
mgnify:CR=1 FL=1